MSGPISIVSQVTPNYADAVVRDTQNTAQVENKTTDWQRFSVICDKKLIVKLRLIAKKEHFTIREVLEYWMRTGINKYENEYGEINEDSHIRVITDVFK